ncbi:hypothetical protein E2C01_058521 [Portunus trituberculatus]|uniref:Uncharacterized protein n=1 Tax=Portunus trituberculatus TaxID=210409 RepID=A0A5B7H3E9_PORTR|nr:hypothetical protein [Portunus trituberculatus]
MSIAIQWWSRHGVTLAKACASTTLVGRYLLSVSLTPPSLCRALTATSDMGGTLLQW